MGRGAGTGLSGGAIPREGGIIDRLRAHEPHSRNRSGERARAWCEPGVVNLDITLAVQAQGYFYAPDPSSQRACTIGGNVAENAGGPHTLAYGVTTNHVLGLEVVLPDGTVMTTGGKEPDLPGYDLTGLADRLGRHHGAGHEGHRAADAPAGGGEDHPGDLRSARTTAARTVAEITARAITPVAVEMLDGVMLRMVEEATHAGYPMDAAAVLLIELEGLREAVEEQVEQIREVCQSCRAREFRVARTAEERDLLWKGRKNAFGAVGRVSPTYYVQDGVVPRTQIAPTLRFIGEVGRKYGLTISNIFHAGDGNMHPIILFDARKPGDLEKAAPPARRFWSTASQVGGSITGEHGVGMEKNEMMGRQFSAETLDMMRALQGAVRSRRTGSIPARCCPRERAAWRSASRRWTLAGLPIEAPIRPKDETVKIRWICVHLRPLSSWCAWFPV